MLLPETRAELIELVTTSFARPSTESDAGGPGLGDLPCVDDWNAGDLLTVRAWWTEHVVDRVEAGRRGGSRPLPAAGDTGRETPRLNTDVVEAARTEAHRSIRQRRERGGRKGSTAAARPGDESRGSDRG